MKTMSIDIETYSSVELKKAGVYAYTSALDFEILLFAYAFDDEPVQIVDLASSEKLPLSIVKVLTDERILKTAFNANFERTCLSVHLNKSLSPSSWRCTAVQAATLGLPLHLAGVAKVLGLNEQKMSEGKALIRYFSIPCKPTEVNGGRTKNLPEHAPEKWSAFKDYCKRDVEVERAIRKKLQKHPMSDNEQKLWVLDQQINDRGILVDTRLVHNAIQCDKRYRVGLFEEARSLTGLDNPNSVAQLKEWLLGNGVEVASLSKKAVSEMASNTDGEIHRLLQLRQEMAKTSIKKYNAIQRAICPDDHVRGLLQFYGANRTGRWSGRLIQIHNLPQNHLPDLELARDIVKSGDFDLLEMLYDSVPSVLSELIRTAFIPPEGHRLIVADFSAIEARVIAWLAGEQWVTETFKGHGKIYEMTASRMFGVPFERIVKGNPEYEMRAKGKVATLACIAEGQLVLTDQGLMPIESVTLSHKVWDGETFVKHDGVLYKGESEVISYAGLTATKDHLVWIEGQSEPVRFDYAAASGAYLVQSGNGRETIRVGEDYQSGKTLDKDLEQLSNVNPMCKLWSNTVDSHSQFNKGPIERLSSMFTAEENTALVRPKVNSGKTTLHQPKRPGLRQLWSKRYTFQIPQCLRSWTVDHRKFRLAGQKSGFRQIRQQRTLRGWKFALGNSCEEFRQSTHNRFVRMEPSRMALCKKRRYKKTYGGHEQGTDYIRSKRSCRNETKELAIDSSKVRVYDLLNVGKHNRFTVSNCLVHNCGYQGGANALIALGALEMGLKEEELDGLVKAWRKANSNIVKYWYAVENAAKRAIAERVPTALGNAKFQVESGILFITLPSGRRLSYIKPKMELNKFGRKAITYEGIGENKQWCRMSTYGGRLVENCLAGDSLVLSNNGWKTIRTVNLFDLLWDGDGWVRHDGVIEKGAQATITIDGVRMTEEHLILTTGGWKNASSCEGLNRAEVQLPESDIICRFGREKITLGSTLRLWKRVYYDSHGICKWKAKIMRMYSQGFGGFFQHDSWNVKASGVCSMAINDRSLSAAFPSGMEELWGSRNKSVQKLAIKFSELLGGYGRQLCFRPFHRKDRCKRRLLTGQLQVGDTERTDSKQTIQSMGRITAWLDDYSRISRAHRYWRNNFAISDKQPLSTRTFTRTAGLYEPVYDIINSGVKNRFTVLGDNGPFFVHNCVQAIARDCLADAMQRINKAGYKIAMHVHDEVVISASEGFSSLEEVCDIMGQPIPWAEGLPLKAAGFEANFYKKD